MVNQTDTTCTTTSVNGTDVTCAATNVAIFSYCARCQSVAVCILATEADALKCTRSWVGDFVNRAKAEAFSIVGVAVSEASACLSVAKFGGTNTIRAHPG